MKTMITIIWSVCIIIAILYLMGIQITFKPFSIKFTSLMNGLGNLFMIAALVCFGIHNFDKGYNKGELKGYKQGSRDMRDAVLEMIDNKAKEDENKTNIK